MRIDIVHGLVTFSALGRAAVPLAGNLTSLLGGAPLAKAPVYVTWAVTERCNMRCRHCSFGPATPEATEPQRATIARRLADSSAWGVSLIGGEPTLVPTLVEHAQTLKRAGKYVSVGTSGHRLSRLVDGLVAAGVDTLVISADHHRADEHDAFRGRPGLFAEIEAVVQHLVALPGPRPRVQIRTTIHRDNMREVPDIVDFWRARADHVVLQVIQDNGIHSVRDPTVLFRPDDRPALEAAVAELIRRNPNLRSRYFEHLAAYVFEKAKLQEQLDYRCMVVPGASLTVMPDGELRLCYGHDESRVGTLLDSPLEELWRSAATGRLRRAMQSRELGCMCWEQVNSANLDLLPWVHRAERLLGRGGR